MTVFRVLLLANGILMMMLVFKVSSYRCLFKYIKQFKKTGVIIDWYALLPFPKRVKALVKRINFYPKVLAINGLSKEDQMVMHLLTSVFIPFMCVIGFIKDLRHWRIYIMLVIASQLGKYMLLTYYKKQRNMAFNRNAYRLYKFLHNQISAGVQPKESMMSLYKIVKEPFLRERLQALGSMYAQTLDFDVSFEEISKYYDGSDVNSLRIAIIQGIDLGNNLNTLKKQEALMFSKYMNYLQLETNRQKARTFVVVTIYCMIIIFMIGLPLMMELSEAIDMIFMK